MKFLTDFLPILLFFVAYQLYDIYVATAVAIAASALQVGYLWLFRKKIEKMHLVTLGLLVIFGGLDPGVARSAVYQMETDRGELVVCRCLSRQSVHWKKIHGRTHDEPRDRSADPHMDPPEYLLGSVFSGFRHTQSLRCVQLR